MTEEEKSTSEPVTMLLVRTVRQGRLQDFEDWITSVKQVVRGFAGYLGTDIIRPRDHGHQEYVIMARFDSYEHLRAWMSSKEREELLKKSENLTIGATHVQEAHGFEPWFTLPERAVASNPPPKYKMALLTILAIYPSLLALSTLLSYLFPTWPRPF
jgi:uncharacterized protein